MKHVLVETNFLIDVLRPFAQEPARRLLARSDRRELCLHAPWVALTEAKRTLTRVIDKEDLAFMDSMMKWSVRQLHSGALTKDEMAVIQRLHVGATSARAAALDGIETSIDAVAARVDVIHPTAEVITKTLALHPIKSLPPFDEMILGAVLATADALYQSGERAIWFCNLNKHDFDPSKRPLLAAEYARCGISFLASFDVP